MSNPANRGRGRGRPRHPDVLTPSEWRTVHAVQHGRSNRAVAENMGVSINAVKYHLRNVLAKLDLPDRRALRGWFAIPKHSALDRQERMMAGNPELSAIGQVARSVADIETASRFFSEVVGLPHLYTFGKLAFFECGSTRLMLQQGETVNADESVLYFRVDDIVGAKAALEQRGAKFTHAPHMIHRHEDGLEEWMAFFSDPEGRPLAIMAQVRQSQV